MQRVRYSVLVLFAVLSLFGSPPVVTLATSVVQSEQVTSGASAVPGQFVITWSPGTPAEHRRAAVQAQGGRGFGRIADLDVDAVEFPTLKHNPNPAAEAALLNRLKRDPNVEAVEPNLVYKAAYTPTDPAVGQQYAWNTIQAFSAWNTTRGRRSTIIAIVDSGIHRSHSDLDGKIVPGYDYVQGDTVPDDEQGHGTHVAGTAAAETRNGVGGGGTCPNCRLMPVRILDRSGQGTMFNLAIAIDYAVNHGAKIINLSLEGGFSYAVRKAVNNAWNKGVFLACAAGNGNTSSKNSAYPGAYANCFAVASTTATDARSSFSNYGTWVEAAAPGSAIYSTWNNGGYNTIDGTSMATPHVAGLAGLLASEGLSNVQIRQRICETSDKISGAGASWRCGRINANRAVNNITSTAPVNSETVAGSGDENSTSP